MLTLGFFGEPASVSQPRPLRLESKVHPSHAFSNRGYVGFLCKVALGGTEFPKIRSPFGEAPTSSTIMSGLEERDTIGPLAMQ